MMLNAGPDAGRRLVRYDAACQAIAAAKSIDEAREIRDMAEALRAYARMARNRELEVDAAEIRERAEIRLGEIVAEQRRTVGLADGGDASRARFRSGTELTLRKTLAEVGIDKKLSARSQRLAAMSKERIEAHIAAWRVRMLRESGRVSLAMVAEGGQAGARAAREQNLGQRIAALPNRRYGVIYADPPWRFEVFSRDTGVNRAADNHYPTSPTDAIAATPVASIAADHCILFLWATAPMLLDGLDVLEAWGFEYRSHLVWVKPRMGTGYWFRNQHELLLLGVRGRPPAPAPGEQAASVLTAPLGRHSEKPEAVAELIERTYPNLPKVELYRRGKPRPGWDAWGFEAEPA